MRSSLLTAALLMASCSHVAAESQTAAEHRNDAAIHQQRAEVAKAEADPSDLRRSAPRLAGTAMFGRPETTYESYNPSDESVLRADAELREANAHVAAARKLERFEAEACEGLSAGERSSCPLLASSVARVEANAKGFTLIFKPTVDATQTSRVLRCHLAYAISTGFDRPSCPLFLRGTTLEDVGKTGLAFVGNSDEVAAELRDQARRVFVGRVQTRSN